MSFISQMIGQGAQSVLTSYGLKEQGKADRRAAETRMQAAEFEARLMEQRAGQELAVAQRQKFEEQRVAGLVASRAQAVAAASGGGASDTTVVNIISRVKGEGAYRAAVRLYEGESKARMLRLAASAKRYEGATGVIEAAAAQKIGNRMGLFNLITGGGSIAGKYGSQSFGGGGTSGGQGGWLDAGSQDMGTTA